MPNFYEVLDRIPDWKRYMTVDELHESTARLVNEHPEIELIKLGRSTEGENIDCLRLGDGRFNALIHGFPNCEEPFGGNLLDYLSWVLAEDEEMIRLGLASTWHWTQREDCTQTNLSIGYWQTSRIYAMLGQADNARRYGHLCLAASQAEDVPPFYLGYAYEALARAEAVAGDGEHMEEYLAEAHRVAGTVPDDDARQMLLVAIMVTLNSAAGTGGPILISRAIDELFQRSSYLLRKDAEGSPSARASAATSAAILPELIAVCIPAPEEVASKPAASPMTMMPFPKVRSFPFCSRSKLAYMG